MEWHEHVISDSRVLLGKPTVKGTRISVEHIIGLLAQGWTEQQILENYPRLTNKALQAVLDSNKFVPKESLLQRDAFGMG